MDNKILLDILGDDRICSTWDDLTPDQRIAIRKGDLNIVSLETAVVAKSLKERLTEAELAIVAKWIENETSDANEAGWHGAVARTSRADLDRANDASVIVRLPEDK